MFNSIADSIHSYGQKVYSFCASTPIGPVAIASAINRFAGAGVLNATNLVCSAFSGIRAVINMPYELKNLTSELINYFNKKSTNITIPLNRIAIDVYIIYMSYYSIKSSFREGYDSQENCDIDMALINGLFVASIANFVQAFKISATAAYNNRNVDAQEFISSLSWGVFNMYTYGIKINSLNVHFKEITDRNTSYPFRGLRPADAEPFTNFHFPNRSDDTVLFLQAKHDHNGAHNNRTVPIFYELYSQHKKVYFAKNIMQNNFCSTIKNTRFQFKKLIDVLIMQVHGDPESMVWDVIGNKSIAMHITQPVSAYNCIDKNLAPDAKIVLVACQAGKKRLFNAPNIAEWTSQVALGRMVFASTESISLGQVRYSYKNKSLDTQFLSFYKGKNITQIYQSFKVSSFPSNPDAIEPLLNSFFESFGSYGNDLYNSVYLISLGKDKQENDDTKDWTITT
jgi:hypothetical protein